MGGMIGQTLALEHPELFASLALCDTSSRIPAEAQPLWANSTQRLLRLLPRDRRARPDRSHLGDHAADPDRRG